MPAEQGQDALMVAALAGLAIYLATKKKKDDGGEPPPDGKPPPPPGPGTFTIKADRYYSQTAGWQDWQNT